MIYDATSIYSSEVYGSSHKFVLLQLGWILVGLLGFLLFFLLDYRKISAVAYSLFFVSLCFLVFLAVVSLLPCNSGISFTPCINGANRWIFFNPAPLPQIPFLGVLGFQPAELAKLSLILYLAFQIALKARKEDSFWVYFIASGLFSFLVLLQPNMSTAMMIFLIGSIIYFSSGFTLKPLFLVGPLLVVLTIAVILVSPYRRMRLTTFLTGEGRESSEGYHAKQITIALGSGGFSGVGFGQSRQKYQYLPEVASDSIFAIIGEELGFIGTTFVLMFFSYFLYLGFLTVRNAPDLLGRLLAVGITSWMGLQFFVNAAAMTKIIPLTGVPMPLISYGGSSMVFSLMGLGILANISKQS